MNWWVGFVCSGLLGCVSLNKKDHPTLPTETSAALQVQLDIYRPLVKAQADSHGLMVMGTPGSIGDSALFSCLARAGGALDFDPAILFTSEGKPLRHPDIAPSAIADVNGGRGTPISHDMMDGILWCLYDLHRKGDTQHAQDLLTKMIAFGTAHQAVGNLGWMFCTNEDKVNYHISEDDWIGRCMMPPSMVKDIYRVAKLVGIACDDECQQFMLIGTDIPVNHKGFERHLEVISTVRNGYVEGAINDNSLKLVLKKAHDAEPRNGVYQAAYRIFESGDQTDAYKALSDERLFPKDHLPTSDNFCTEYLFQRDDDSATNPKSDWLPCPGKPGIGRGVEWVFAATLALGELKNTK